MYVTPEGEEAEVDIPSEPCNGDEFAGTWQSTDEEGAKALVLTLVDGGSILQSDGTTERIGEWFCMDSTLIAITDSGEERELATINDDGTLTIELTVLSRT